MKFYSVLTLSLLTIVFAASLIKTESLQRSYFHDEHFLKNSVDTPKVYQDEELDELLHKVFKKVVTMRGVKTGESVKIDENGIARKSPSRIPVQKEKRGEKSNPKYEKNGMAIPAKERIPGVVNKKRDQAGTLKDITDSVDKLIADLSSTKYYVLRKDKNMKKDAEKKFKFEEVDEKPGDYKEFKDKFFRSFLHSTPGLINIGKDNNNDIVSARKSTGSLDNAVEDKRLDTLYEELKQQTKKESDKITAELQKQKRIESVKKELLDILNSIQHRETFTYDGEKFGLASENVKTAEPGLIGIGKDTKRSGVATNSDEEKIAKRLDSRLETVDRLIKELRELKDNQKRESIKKTDYSSANFHENTKKSESSTRNENRVATTKVKNDRNARIRGVLVDLVDELQKRISSQNKSPLVSEKRIEKELDEIASTSLNTKKDVLSDEAIRKVVDGFNVKKENTLRARKEIKNRP